MQLPRKKERLLFVRCCHEVKVTNRRLRHVLQRVDAPFLFRQRFLLMSLGQTETPMGLVAVTKRPSISFATAAREATYWFHTQHTVARPRPSVADYHILDFLTQPTKLLPPATTCYHLLLPATIYYLLLSRLSCTSVSVQQSSSPAVQPSVN